MSVVLEDSFYFKLGTSSASTGAATNADSTPVVTIEEDGVALGYSPSVVNVSTGEYRVTVNATAANGFEVGKRYCMSVSATVGGIVGKDGVGEFEVVAAAAGGATADEVWAHAKALTVPKFLGLK